MYNNSGVPFRERRNYYSRNLQNVNHFFIKNEKTSDNASVKIGDFSLVCIRAMWYNTYESSFTGASRNTYGKTEKTAAYIFY